MEDASSPFRVAQCGNYNPATQFGFIRGDVLYGNTYEHEAGTTLGHYQQYTSFQDQPAHNLAILAESRASMGADFVAQTKQFLDNQATAVIAAMTSEAACNSITNYDTSCTYRGPINFRINGLFGQCP